MEMGGGQGGPGGQDSGVDSYAAANEYSSDETVSDTSLESTETNENAALVPTAQKLHLTMMQSPEHRQTVRAVTIPAFMV